MQAARKLGVGEGYRYIPGRLGRSVGQVLRQVERYHAMIPEMPGE